MWEGEAMTAAVRRPGRARSLRRAALLAPALAALVMLAGAGAAQEGAGGNADQAIEITADTLEVRQSENVAVFQGDVNAVQGEMVLNADMLTVFYREAAGAEGNLGVSRIEAEGNVVVTSPEETAKGKSGVYDVEEARIDLAGDVLLNRGNNIIEGQTLTMDLASGVSRVSGTASGRVRGLFVPDEEGE